MIRQDGRDMRFGIDPLGEELRVKAEDAMLYDRNINEGDEVCFDESNKLEKVNK